MKLFAIWFSAGLLATALAVAAIRPLAGLFFLIVAAGLLVMFVAPVLHIVLRRSRASEYRDAVRSPVPLVLLILAALVVVLMFSGLFNFA
jgi:hypothetical protein